MVIGFDAKRAFHNRTGLGNFSRWHIELMLKTCAEDKFVLFSPDAGHSDLFHPEHKNLRNVNFGNGFLGNYKRVFPGNSMINNDVQVYHGLSNELPFGKSWSKGIKTIVTVHDLIFMKFPDLYDAGSRAIYRMKLRRSVEEADLIHCVSRSTANDLMSYTGVAESRIMVIPLGKGLVSQLIRNPVKVRDEGIVPQRNEPFLLCVSSTEARKNLLRLVKAFSQSGMQNEWQLIIAGKKGDTSTDLHQEILRTGMTDRIKVIENPESAVLRMLYERASAFIYPSLYEGFGIPVLEALHFRLPVLCSETSSLPEVGGNAAWYFNPGDVEQMSQIIGRLNDAGALAQLQAHGAHQLEYFNDDRIGDQWKTIYHSMI